MLHDVRVDDSHKSFAFASEGDADRFCKFIWQYQRSGPGNGYGAYWITFEDIQFAKAIPSGAEQVIDTERIERMAHSILRSRGVDTGLDYTPPLVGRKRGAITFEWALLSQ
ncbi:MAG: hypothetical protein WC217_02920 [Candidatus Paceibacterota bacterium]